MKNAKRPAASVVVVDDAGPPRAMATPPSGVPLASTTRPANVWDTTASVKSTTASPSRRVTVRLDGAWTKPARDGVTV